MEILQLIDTLDTETLLLVRHAVDKRIHSMGLGKYSKSKIYCVRQIQSKAIVYVGSTIQTLRARWSEHKSFIEATPNNKWALYVKNNGGHRNFLIELVEDFPCLTLKELLVREKH